VHEEVRRLKQMPASFHTNPSNLDKNFPEKQTREMPPSFKPVTHLSETPEDRLESLIQELPNQLLVKPQLILESSIRHYWF
jgi:hypothetical protein